MNDGLRHWLTLPCLQWVTGHAYKPGGIPDRGEHCTWREDPHADACDLPERCHEQHVQHVSGRRQKTAIEVFESRDHPWVPWGRTVRLERASCQSRLTPET